MPIHHIAQLFRGLPFFLAILCGALVCGVPVSGCSHRVTLRIQVPATFRGHVEISCDGTAEGNREVHIDASGHANDSGCPNGSEDLVIVRDGAVVSTRHGVPLLKTGDGIPVGYAFDVQ